MLSRLLKVCHSLWAAGLSLVWKLSIVYGRLTSNSHRTKRPRAGGVARLQPGLPRDDTHQHEREQRGLLLLEHTARDAFLIFFFHLIFCFPSFGAHLFLLLLPLLSMTWRFDKLFSFAIEDDPISLMQTGASSLISR